MRKLYKYYKLISSYNYSTLAGAISFFFIVNGGSILFLTFVFLNVFNIDIVEITSSSLNEELEVVFRYIYNNSYEISQSYSFFFILTSIWTSSSLFFHMIRIGEIIYKVPHEKYKLSTRIFAIILVIVFLVLLLCTMFFIILSRYILSKIKYKLLYIIIQSSLALIIPLVIIIFFNLFVSPTKARFKELRKGIAFTVIFWIVVTIGLTIYLNIFMNFKVIYGALAFFIIFMIWIYLLAQGLIIGLIINHQNWLKLHDEKYLEGEK